MSAVGSSYSGADTKLVAARSIVFAAKCIVEGMSSMVVPSMTKDKSTMTIESARFTIESGESLRVSNRSAFHVSTVRPVRWIFLCNPIGQPCSPLRFVEREFRDYLTSVFLSTSPGFQVRALGRLGYADWSDVATSQVQV